MGERIASGDIYINVQDEKALADLRRIDAEFDRTMRRIDGQKAEVEVTGDLHQLKDDLANAKRMLRQLEAQKATVELDADKKQLVKDIAEAKRLIKQIDGEVATVEIEVKGNEQELKAAEERLKAIEKREVQRQKVLERLDRERMRRIERESRVSAALNRQRSQELSRAHNEALKLNREYDNRLRSIEKEKSLVPTLKRQYAELGQTLEKLATARRKSHDARAKEIIDFKITETEAKMRGLRERLERIGSPINLDVDIHPGHAMGAHIRQALQSGGVRGAAHVAGMALGDSMVTGFKRRFTRDALTAPLRRAGSILGNLSNMTVRLGPFTATIRQLGVAMSVFAPTILDLVGALGALVGVVGAAALGVGALGAAFIGGAIPGALGLFAVLKPLTAEFSSAMKASKAYHDALAKGNADLAKKKLGELNHILGNVDERTKANFRSAGDLSKRWKELTAPARTEAFKTIGAGLAFANANMRPFARNTNQLARALGGGLRGLMKNLDTGAINTMMDNFNASVKDGVGGLSNLLNYLLRVGAAASRSLPGLAKGFRDWTKGLLNTSALDNFQGRIDRLIDAARSVGRFFMAAGRFLSSFFSAGVASGERLTDTMTNALNRWAEFNRSTAGRMKLAEFFDRSVTGAQQLYNALAPLIASFVEWAANMSPVVSGFLQGVSAVSRFVAALLDLTHLAGPLSTVAATLGALWAVGRISAATRALSGFGAALVGVSRAQKAVAVTGAASSALTAGSPLAGAAMGAGAGRAAREVGILRGAATRLIPAIGGMGAVAGGAATAGLTILAGAAAYGAYKLITMKTGADKVRDALNHQRDVSNAAAGAYRSLADGSASVALSYRRTNLTLKEARRQLKDTKKGTDEHAFALQNYREALLQNNQAGQQWKTVQAQMRKTADDQFKSEQKRIEQSKKATEIRLAQLKAERARSHQPYEASKAINKQIDEAQHKYDGLTAAAERAANRQAAAGLNIARAWRGMLPVLGQAEQQLGKLARSRPALAQKIAVKYEAPRDAGRVAAQARRALGAGAPIRQVLKIVADSKNAEQAVRRLNAMSIDRKTLMILESGGPAAVAMLEKIIGKKLTPKQQSIAQRGGPAVIGLLQRILGIKIPTKTTKVTANAGQALGAIGSVVGALAGLRDKTVTITTISKTVALKRSGGLAVGRGPGGAETALVGEGRSGKGAAEMIADYKDGSIFKVDRPQLLRLSPTQAVIPTEPTYRARGAGLLADFAKAMGIPGFAKGKDPKKQPASPRAKARARSQARKHSPKRVRYASDNLIELKGVEKAQLNEEDARKRIDLDQQKLKEPETFLKNTGTEQNPRYEIDQDAINSWTSQLAHMESLYDILLKRIEEVNAAVTKALTKVNSVINRATNNIKKLNKLEAVEQRILNSNKTSRAAKDMAKERLRVYKEQESGQKTAKDNAWTDKKSLLAERHDIPFRREQAQIDKAGFTEERLAVANKAAAELKSQTPTSGTGSGPMPSPEEMADMARQQGFLLGRGVAVSTAIGSVLSGPGDIGTGSPSSPYSAAAAVTRSVQGNPLAAVGAGLTSGLSSPYSSPSFSALSSSSRATRAAAASGAGVASGGSGGTVINQTINTLHPGDPAVHAALASTATKGFNSQPVRPATRGNIGL